MSDNATMEIAEIIIVQATTKKFFEIKIIKLI